MTDRLSADESSITVVEVTLSQSLIEYEQVKVHSVVQVECYREIHLQRFNIMSPLSHSHGNSLTNISKTYTLTVSVYVLKMFVRLLGLPGLHGLRLILIAKSGKINKKPCYRKCDRAMRRIYGCPGQFKESLATPTATFPEIVNGLLLGSIA